MTSYESTKRLNTVASMVDIDDLQELDEESKFFIVGVPQFLSCCILTWRYLTDDGGASD